MRTMQMNKLLDKPGAGAAVVVGTLLGVSSLFWLGKRRSAKFATFGCPAGSPSNPLPRASAAEPMARVPVVAERLRRLWTAGTGDAGPPCDAAVELLLAHAILESGAADPKLGDYWKDEMKGSGNLGAIHCGDSESGGATYRCVPYKDTRPNPDGTSTSYPTKMRFYIDGAGRTAGDNAALDFLKQVSRAKPESFLRDKSLPSSFAMRFRLSGWPRIANEFGSEALTLGAGGLLLMYMLALPAFIEVDSVHRSDLAVGLVHVEETDVGGQVGPDRHVASHHRSLHDPYPVADAASFPDDGKGPDANVRAERR
jgi:hypothetical protein